MADLNAALVQQFLNISVAEREAVVQPHSVLDDDHWEAVSVGLGVGHGWSAYPSPVKATQPLLQLSELREMQGEVTTAAQRVLMEIVADHQAAQTD